MKRFASKKIDFDVVKSLTKVALFQGRLYLDSLDPVTKIFRLMVLLTCLYSIVLLNRIKDAQHVLIRNTRIVQQWSVTATPTVAGVATTSAKIATPTASNQDSTPPSFAEIGGPAEGSVINFNNFCFPVRLYDNVSSYPKIFIQYRFDNSVWSGWSNNMAPCFQDILGGSHTISLQAKDEAGNMSVPVSRTFTIQLNQ